MRSLSVIREMNREAAIRAARKNKQPFVIQSEDVDAMKAGKFAAFAKLPYLGDFVPAGWKRVDLRQWFGGRHPRGVYYGDYGDDPGFGAFFVDSSGCGLTWEPALTLSEFADMVRPGFGYAIIEMGQFQVWIGVFERTKDAPRTVKGKRLGARQRAAATPADGVPAPDVLDAYRRLHDGLSDMIEGGRLTRAAIPDDYDWLVESLAWLAGHDPVAAKALDKNLVAVKEAQEPGGTGNMQEADCGPACKRWFDAEAGRWVCGHPDCRDKEMA